MGGVGRVSAVITRSEKEEKNLLQEIPPIKQQLLDQNMFFVRLEGSLHSKFSELIGEEGIYDCKQLTIEDIIGNKELIKALATAK